MKKVLIIALKTLLILYLFALIAFSLFGLYKYNEGKNESKKLASEIIVNTNLDEIPIDVDFETLKEKNDDIIGWLYCPNTPLNYAIVQAEDNEYYLQRDFNKEYSNSGTLFADCRNSGDFSDKNTVIYGHNMKNNSMFATLIKYKNDEYYKVNPVMYLITPDKKYTVELIAGVVKKSSQELYDNLLQEENVKYIIDEALLQSTFDTNYVFDENDRFVTLSTCSYDYDDARFILIGKLHN